jgi:hypothetical protein
VFIDPYWPWPSEEEEEKEELFLSPPPVHVQSLLSSPFWSSASFPKVVLEGTAKRHGLGVFLFHIKHFPFFFSVENKKKEKRVNNK